MIHINYEFRGCGGEKLVGMKFFLPTEEKKGLYKADFYSIIRWTNTTFFWF